MRPVRIARRGAVDLHVIDGATTWLAPPAPVRCGLARARVTVRRTPERRDPITAEPVPLEPVVQAWVDPVLSRPGAA